MLETDESGLLNADLADPINLFVGSGFSTLAKNQLGGDLPTGDDLRKMILTEFNKSSLDQLDLQSLYTIVLSEQKDRLQEYIVDIFTVEKFNDLYEQLRTLDISHIYTTNVDDLPFKIFRPIDGRVSPILHDVATYGQPRDRSTVIQYIPLHGSVRHEERNFVFTGGQISSAFAADQQTWYVFQRELQARPTFFLGYSLRDAGVLQALQNAAIPASRRWILVRSKNDQSAEVYKSLGFHIIYGNTKDFLEYIRDTPMLSSGSAVTQRPKLGRIPRRDEVALRPVREFFLGGEPTWSDAYSPQIQKRRANDQVMNLALSGSNVAVVGLPLSGKSTIVKQEASELIDKRQCIYFDKLSLEAADELIAEHAGTTTKPIIFIDQFIDSRQAFNKVALAGNFKFVVAESSIYFDSINTKVLAAKLEVVPCSEISRPDLQRIITSLPVDVRRTDISDQQSEEDISNFGLFEGLIKQVFDRGLIARFRARLREFEQKDQEAFDVYIMSCYVNSCRTLVSYDMMHMFLRSRDYTKGYKIVNKINEFIRETENPDDDSQDFFEVKSSALARTALKVCSKSAFGRVFDQFHRLINPRIIPDYPAFRRYGYDNDYAVKAYPDHREGKSFYNRVFLMTGSAYEYQHGAIYMSKMHQHEQAFEWIDLALSKAGKRNFVIRNSHAVILFEANIAFYRENPVAGTAWESICESMKVLQECIDGDAWRRYHILRFGDQAKTLAGITMNATVFEWLIVAKSKLEAALADAKRRGSRESYNAAKYQRLLRDVDRTIAEA